MTRRRIGLVYDLLGSFPARPGDPLDVDAEYEPEATLALLEAAIRALGHEPVRLGAPADLLARIGKGQLPALDCALNIAEGTRGRDREAWAPVLLQLAGIPALGSDALTLSATLDKAWATRLVAAAGVPVPFQVVMRSAAAAQSAAASVRFPLFVKPRWEGSAKGIRVSSKVADPAALVREVARIVRDYDQPALVEAFLPGAEYTVTVVGNAPPRALPVLQRALDADTGIGIHAVERGLRSERVAAAVTPGELSAELEAELSELALRSFEALECLDFARADFKLDATGRPLFLEMNPLPTFAPDASFGILAELAGRPVQALVAEVLAAGLERLELA
ncbi:MAG: D-alanine--D-alanine ligase [Deltaproteobacteria bacterium]|nr:D-alanine--D-alanine ligase [Deltaproteobacteria bacterium]MBW2360663.1 D-alanine--D-alanine ligase [Deltaproteobacteria bacterium]